MDRGRENRDGNGLPQGHKKATKIVPLAKKKKKTLCLCILQLKTARDESSNRSNIQQSHSV